MHRFVNNKFCRIGICFLGLCTSLRAQTQTKPKSTPSTAMPGARSEENAQVYRNAEFGFRYRIPYGWVDRTREMNVPEHPETARGESSSVGSSKAKAAEKAAVLLGVFERPPEATADSINSGVVIASESMSAYPGVKRAEDYVGPLTDVATAQGFHSAGEAYAVEEESRRLVRVDFVKPLKDKLIMRQCSLILLTKGQIVSFTFIADSEEGLDEIMDGLHFGSAKTP
jgi:hypothetical protein